MPAKASMPARIVILQTPSAFSSPAHDIGTTMSGALGLGGYSSSEDEDETIAPISKSNQVTIAFLEHCAQTRKKGRMSC